MQGHGHASTVGYIAVMVKEAEESWMMGKSEASKKIKGLKEKVPA